MVQSIMGITTIAVPIYADSLGASPFLLGIIGGAGGLMNSFVPLVSGALSDRFRRKGFMTFSMCLCSLSCLLYYFSEDPFKLVAIKMLESVSLASFWPIVEALISDASGENLDESLRKFNVSWGSAMVVGPFIGGGLISAFSPKAPFVFALAIAAFVGSASPALVKEPRKRPAAAGSEGRDSSRKNGAEAPIAISLASIFLFSSLGGIVFSLFPAYATNLGIPAYEVGLIMLAWGVARVATFYGSTEIEKRFSKKGMFVAGSSMLAAASFLIAKSLDFYSFVACFLVFGFGGGISYSASISSILGRWSFSRGYAAGLFESLIGVGYFLGPLMGGAISTYGTDSPYVFGSFLGLAVLAIQIAVYAKRPSSNRKR
ncbi:MAG: MFS transporter [Candidatus Brockarchaeota archaeon]|nr:MFS transporter [Candidatus Brockarchaeota archaeon]